MTLGEGSADRFAELIGEPEIRLDLAALEIARVCRPGEVDVEACLATLDDLAEQVSQAAVQDDPAQGKPLAKSVTNLLYGQLGFGGNRSDYYQPANSFLDQVLANRSGIPITLAVVTMEVARRVGVRMYGVGMPRHFLVGVPPEEVVSGQPAPDQPAPDQPAPLLFDPFDGVYLDHAGAKELFERLGQTTPADPVPFRPEFLNQAPTLQILRRMLNNLRLNYLHRAQPTSLQGIKQLAAVLEMLVCLPDCPPTDYLQLASVLNSLGRPDAGAKHLLAGADQLSDPDSEVLQAEAERLLARLN